MKKDFQMFVIQMFVIQMFASQMVLCDDGSPDSDHNIIDSEDLKKMIERYLKNVRERKIKNGNIM